MGENYGMDDNDSLDRRDFIWWRFVEFCIARNSWQNKELLPLESAETYILFGHCADFISKETKSNILINPPRHFKSDSANLSKIYIPKWETKYGRLREKFPQEKIVNF